MRLLAQLCFLCVPFLLAIPFHETDSYTQLPTKCDSPHCVPFAKFSFEYVWETYPIKDSLSQFNDYIQRNELGYQNIFEAIFDDQEERIKLIAATDVKIGDLLADSPTRQLLAATGRIEWELFKKDTQIYKTVKSLGKLKQDQFDEKFINLLYFILSILSHLHNIEDSLLKPELLVLPRKINYPAYTLTEYEINLVKSDGLNGEVLGLRQSVKKSFEGFQKIIHSSFTKKQVNILFNGHRIIEQDFVYAYSLIFFFSPQNQWILKGFVNSIRDNQKQELHPIKGYQDKEKNENHIKIFAPNDFKKGEEIKIDTLFPLSLKFLVNEFPDGKIENDCQPVFLLGKEQARLYKHEEKACLTNETIFHYYTLQNLINMNSQQYSDCIKILKHKLKRAYKIVINKFKDEAIFDYCVHPKVNSSNNIILFGAKQYEERMDGYNFYLKKAEEYLDFRSESNLDTSNAQLIIKYLKHKRAFTKQLIKEIHRYTKINQQYADTVKKVYDFGVDEFPDLEDYHPDQDDATLEGEVIESKDQETQKKNKKLNKKESLELEERDEL